MSYCRWGEGDVYLYPGPGREIYCCACRLAPLVPAGDETDPFEMHDDTVLHSIAAALVHLRAHVAAGHAVPDRAFQRLEREAAEAKP